MARRTQNSTSRDASTSGKSFPQRFTVVEHHPDGGSTFAVGDEEQQEEARRKSKASSKSDEQDRFTKNSKAMGDRATNDLHETLRWVAELSIEPVDRLLLRQAARSMKPNVYRDVMTERWVNDMCAYPPCERAPRRPYNAEQPIYRISLRAKRVFDTSAAMKFCSDDCARRSIWYETVCLQQNAFEVADFSQPIQLLEDTEERSSTIIPALAASSYVQDQEIDPSPASSTSPDTPSANDGVTSSKADRHVHFEEQDQYAVQAYDFLARLSIIERQPTRIPLPPNEESASQINQEDHPSLTSATGQSLYSMSAMSDALPASTIYEGEAGRRGGSSTTVTIEERAGLSRRIEIDVDPEYRELMDESFELYRQMKAAGELT